jgi:DNA gyrase subunit A
MQRSYLDYAMSVIVGRALPDVRDGLKPVHRRVLYAMYDGGYRPDRGYSKCSRVVGDVMGSTTRTATAPSTTPSCASPSRGRCATRWSTARATSARRATTRRRHALHRVPDGAAGHGDGAGHRRGDRRLHAELRRPHAGALVLPSRFPNLLVNGSAGIAVGMATNIPPHNLREVAEGVQWALENPEASRRSCWRRCSSASRARTSRPAR